MEINNGMKLARRRLDAQQVLLAKGSGEWVHTSGCRLIASDVQQIVSDMYESIRALNKAYFAKCGGCDLHPSQCKCRKS